MSGSVVVDPSGIELADPSGDIIWSPAAPSTALPDPTYDLIGAFDLYAPGVVLQRSILDALAAQYAANDYTHLTQSQVVAIAGPLPSYPTGLPRFPDSNPEPWNP